MKFVPIRDRIGPLLAIFARLYGKFYKLDKTTGGWTTFKIGVDIRNRITHPKNAQSFTIGDAELDTVERARKWYADTIEALLHDL